MSTTNIPTQVDELSMNFEDYVPEARAKYEGTHMFVGVHVPIEFARRIPLGAPVTLTFTEAVTR